MEHIACPSAPRITGDRRNRYRASTNACAESAQGLLRPCASLRLFRISFSMSHLHAPRRKVARISVHNHFLACSFAGFRHQ